MEVKIPYILYLCLLMSVEHKMPLLISHTRLTPTSELSPITRVTVSKAPEARLRLPRCAPAPPSMHACASLDARRAPFCPVCSFSAEPRFAVPPASRAEPLLRRAPFCPVCSFSAEPPLPWHPPFLRLVPGSPGLTILRHQRVPNRFE